MNKTLLSNTTTQKRNLVLLLGLLFFFIQKTEATTFYVNDTVVKGDLYTSAVGSNKNEGTSASSPALRILTIYQKAQDGDTIIVDTGSYADLSAEGELLFTVTKKIKFVIAGITEVVFSRIPLTKKDNAAPKEFYIDKDKPVEREAYLQKKRNDETKKPQ